MMTNKANTEIYKKQTNSFRRNWVDYYTYIAEHSFDEMLKDSEKRGSNKAPNNSAYTPRYSL